MITHRLSERYRQVYSGGRIWLYMGGQLVSLITIIIHGGALYLGQLTGHQCVIIEAGQLTGHQCVIIEAGQLTGHQCVIIEAGQLTGHQCVIIEAGQLTGHQCVIIEAGQLTGHQCVIIEAGRNVGIRFKIRFIFTVINSMLV